MALNNHYLKAHCFRNIFPVATWIKILVTLKSWFSIFSTIPSIWSLVVGLVLEYSTPVTTVLRTF